MTKGLELAEAYYKAYGQEMLRTKFPQVIGQTYSSAVLVSIVAVSISPPPASR